MSDDQEAQEQAAKDMASDQVMPAETAFAVFVVDGAAYAVSDIRKLVVGFEGRELDIESMRRAEPDDMYRYACEVAKDIQVSQTAAKTAEQMMNITAQIQKRLQQDKTQGLTVPGR